ncbi:hypothetical protein HYO62_06050 [Aerococcaceae bacterium DSM 111022]|nr:hypothetical protein [Aerococcaceae bacterium DSM 111022]
MDLKQKFLDLRTIRLRHYGNLAYQRLSNDWYFENVPDELWELWYSPDKDSFITLSKNQSDIKYMSNDELICLIEKERHLISQVEKIFSSLLYEMEEN